MSQDNITNIPISFSSVPLNDLDLIQNIRQDISSELQKFLTSKDVAGHVLISIVNNSGFIDTLIEDNEGKFRHVTISPREIDSVYKLKVRQASPEKGTWAAMQFRSSEDGFITLTEYNYDRKMYTGDSPAAWYTRPEGATGAGFFNLDMEPEDVVYEDIYTDADYEAELSIFPRSNNVSYSDAPKSAE